jgi:hypothetical protein
MIRRAGRRTRVYIEIPTGAAMRARRLQKYLGYGRVEEGTVLVEGQDLPKAMRLLKFPPEIIDCIDALQLLRGTPGIPTPEAILEARVRVVSRLKAAAQAAQAAL